MRGHTISAHHHDTHYHPYTWPTIYQPRILTSLKVFTLKLQFHIILILYEIIFAFEKAFLSSIYRMIQEESAILWEMIVCVILSKNVHMNMGLILNGYRHMVKRRYGSSYKHKQQLRNKKNITTSHHMHRNMKGQSSCVANVKNCVRRTLECT